jgi:(2S)-methylsuccinyl-CoA dehydrogenase
MTSNAIGLDKSIAEEVLKSSSQFITEITKRLAQKCSDGGRVSVPKMDENQLVFYQLAWMKAEQEIAEHFVRYAWDVSAKTSELEQKMSLVFAAETVSHIRGEISQRPKEYLVTTKELEASLYSEKVNGYIEAAMGIQNYVEITEMINEKNHFGSYGLSEDHESFREAFEDFAKNQVAPHAEHVHRHDEMIPEEIIQGLRDMGCFGLCIPESYGGIQPNDKPDNISMLVVTEELSRGSLGLAGSLITRPEILSKALLKGGTQEQKDRFLPRIASGELMGGIMVTEPNYGSDVAGVSVTAKEVPGGFVINGVKTWCTFAGYANLLLILCRTESDPSLKHKGLSILLAEKPRFTGHEFSHKQESGGTIQGKAIGTIGYRGMHSFEVSFEDFFVPAENLLGGQEGRGKGFYYQMEGFAGGRIQTAARANGVMQASMEAAYRYAQDRKVFSKPIYDYNLTKYKIAKMAMIVQASRQYTNFVAKLLDEHKGQMEAYLGKILCFKNCRVGV